MRKGTKYMQEVHINYLKELGHNYTLKQLSQILGFSGASLSVRLKKIGVRPAKSFFQPDDLKIISLEDFMNNNYERPVNHLAKKETRPAAQYSNRTREQILEELLNSDI